MLGIPPTRRRSWRRSEEHTSELQSHHDLVCRLLLEKKKEWGMSWSTDLAIRRHRIAGDVQYDDSDGFTSPWGRLEKGDDGSYYPAGLRSVVRVGTTATP